MKMEVEIKTKVEHPEQSGAVHDHNSPKVNFGCSDPWFMAGDDGTAIPFYLDPAALGVLIDQQPDDVRAWACIPTTTGTSAFRI